MKNGKFLMFVASLAMIFASVSMTSCDKKPEGGDDDGVPAGKGLLNFTVKIPEKDGEYSATKAGPYAPDETVYIEVPTSDEEPLDVTNLQASASFDNNCYAEPQVPSVIDFTQPYKITVVNAKGQKQVNYIAITPVYPKVRFQSVWFKDNNHLGLEYTNCMSMAVNSTDLFVNEQVQSVGTRVRVYDRLTCAHKKDIGVPASYAVQINTDAAGRLLISRYNIHGAGFMVWMYNDSSSAWDLILDYTADAGCPAFLGWRASVCGDLKNGKAYIYATAENDMNYYWWEFNDGVASNVIPQSARYTNAGNNWSFAKVKRRSVDAGSTHFITYCNYDGPTNTGDGSRFEEFGVTSLTQLAPANHGFRIMDFAAFTVRGEEFLVMTSQATPERYSGSEAYVFEITNRAMWKLTPEDDDYRNFRFFKSEVFGGENYEQWGDAAVIVDGDVAHIYAVSVVKSIGDPIGDKEKAGVFYYKMVYGK